MNIKTLFAGIWRAIRRAPVAKWIKPVWKGLLSDEIRKGREALKGQLRAAVSTQGPSVVDRIFDQSQERLKAVVLGQKWLPGDIEVRLSDLIQEHGDRAQASIKAAVEKGGPAAVDAAVDVAFDALLQAVDRL